MDYDFEQKLERLMIMLEKWDKVDEFAGIPVGTMYNAHAASDEMQYFDIVIACPVCGTHHLSYDICPLCGWEEDEIDEDGYSPWNHATFEEYKATFDRIMKRRQKNGSSFDAGYAAGYERGYEDGLKVHINITKLP